MSGLADLCSQSLRRLWLRPWHSVLGIALLCASIIVGISLHARLHAAEAHRLSARQLGGWPVWSVEPVHLTALDRLRADGRRISVSPSAVQGRFPTIFSTPLRWRVEPSHGRVAYTLPVFVRSGPGAPEAGRCSVTGVSTAHQQGFGDSAWLQGTMRCRVVWDTAPSPFGPLREPHVMLSVSDAAAWLGPDWYRDLRGVLIGAPDSSSAVSFLGGACSGTCRVLPALSEHTPRRSRLELLLPVLLPVFSALLMGLLMLTQRQPLRLHAALALLHGAGRWATATHALLQGSVQALWVGVLCAATSWLILSVFGDIPGTRVGEVLNRTLPAMLIGSAIAVALMLPGHHRSLLNVVKENS